MLWALIRELIEAVLRQLSLPLLLFVGAATLLFLISTERFQKQFPKFPRVLATLVKYKLRVVVGLGLVFLFSGVGLGFGMYEGLVSYRTDEGRILFKNPQYPGKVFVVAIRHGRPTVGEHYSTVDDMGRFGFSPLYRDLYDYHVFQLVEDQGLILTGVFRRDLRGTDDQSREYEFPKVTRRLTRVGTYYFDTSKHALDSAALLEDAALPTRLPPDTQLILQFGNADETGDETSNQALGLLRALAVRRSASSGDARLISVDHFVASFGEAWPAVRGDDARALAKNRRVDVYAVSPLADSHATPVLDTISGAGAR